MLRSTTRIPSSGPPGGAKWIPSLLSCRYAILLPPRGRSVRDWLNEFFAGRPAWMNALMVFCAFMAVVYVPWDFFMKPVARDEEVWFGIVLRRPGPRSSPSRCTGRSTRRAPMASDRMRPWMCPWAAVVHRAGGGRHARLAAAVSQPSAPPARAGRLRRRSRCSRARSGAPSRCSARCASPMRERYGEWALVTGASAGIGEAFARALASAGIAGADRAARATGSRRSRPSSRASSVKTRAVEEDLSNGRGRRSPRARSRRISPIAILVNNAGFGGAGRFDKLQPSG